MFKSYYKYQFSSSINVRIKKSFRNNLSEIEKNHQKYCGQIHWENTIFAICLIASKNSNIFWNNSNPLQYNSYSWKKSWTTFEEFPKNWTKHRHITLYACAFILNLHIRSSLIFYNLLTSINLCIKCLLIVSNYIDEVKKSSIPNFIILIISNTSFNRFTFVSWLVQNVMNVFVFGWDTLQLESP